MVHLCPFNCRSIVDPALEDPAERRLKLTTELNNGRLAMVAMTAMLIQSGCLEPTDEPTAIDLLFI